MLAYMWFNLSAAQGHSVAPLSKDFLEAAVMTRERIAEGQRLSREWIEAQLDIHAIPALHGTGVGPVRWTVLD